MMQHDPVLGYKFKPDRSQFSNSRKLPDFDIQQMGLDRVFQEKINLTEEQMKERHPLEYAYERQRKMENPYAKLNENSILITNFPKEIQVTEQWVHDLVLKQDKTAYVNKIQIIESVGSQNSAITNNTAYVIVEFEDEASVASVKRGLRKTWIQDKLLKPKVKKDENMEDFNARTVIIQNFPSHLSSDELAVMMTKFGQVTHIEAPTIDEFVVAELEEKGIKKDYYSVQRQKQREVDYRHAQAVLNDTLELDQKFESLLKETWGEEKAKDMMNPKDPNSKLTKFEMLDKEKLQSFVRVMSTVQMEGIQVENSKTTIGSLQREIESLMDKNKEHGSVPKEQQLSMLKDNETDLQQTLQYLLKNSENLDESQQQFLNTFKISDNQEELDPIHKLQRLSLNELTFAYDTLLTILKDREVIIKRKLKETLDHTGIEERILSDSKDFKRELEDVPDVLNQLYKKDYFAIDQYLGVNEQIQNVDVMKTLPPEEKVYQFMTNCVNHTAERNWNTEQLAHANTDQYFTSRDHVIPHPNISRKELTEIGLGPRIWDKEFREHIQGKVDKRRNEFETPFDEVYHKERKLVQDIIRAETAIKAIMKNLPNPAANRLFDPKDISEHPVFGNLFEQETEKGEVKTNPKYEHSYNQIQNSKYEELIKSGQLSRSDYEAAKINYMENRKTSLGYALVTYSNADEATLAGLLTGGEFKIDLNTVTLMAKERLDHSELDRSYFLKKMQNEGKVVDEREALRNAKSDLRAYENNIDNELPVSKKLQEFKSVAQEMIENPRGKTRRNVSARRTKRELEELYSKMRQMEGENPNVDLTSLFESSKTENIRREQHKRAFQQYKKFEFLKAGVKDPRTAHKKKNLRETADAFEPFNYPPLKDSVAQIIHGGSNIKVMNAGGSLKSKRRGRKFEYTTQDFLEAYLGKDYAQSVDLMENEQNQVFGFQESLKKMFPDKNEYLKMPKIREEQEKLKQYMGFNKVDGESIDPRMTGFLAQNEYGDKLLESMMKAADVTHPTDPTRTKFGDMHDQIEKLKAKMTARGEEGQYEQKDLKQIIHFLEENYKEIDETFTSEQDGYAKVGKHLEEYRQKLEEYEAELANRNNDIRDSYQGESIAKSKEFDAVFGDLYEVGEPEVRAAVTDEQEGEDGEESEELPAITAENAAEVFAKDYGKFMLEEYGEEIEDPMSVVAYKEGEIPNLDDITDSETARWEADQVYEYSTDVEFQANVTDMRRRYESMDAKHGTNFLKQFDEQFRKDYLEAVRQSTDSEEELQMDDAQNSDVEENVEEAVEGQESKEEKEDVIVEDEFESKSMFDMFFGKKNKNKGQDGDNKQNQKADNQKQVRQKIEKDETPQEPVDINTYGPQPSGIKLDETSNLFGGLSSYRATNENLYNFQRLDKTGQINYNDNQDFQKIKKRAQEQTDFMRKRFEAMQEKHMGVPEGERVPHYMDKKGNVHPYSEEYLKQTKFYHENKVWQYNALKHRMDSSDPDYLNPHDPQFVNEMNSLKDTPQDVLLLHPAEAVKEVTPEQYISQYKGHMTFNKTSLKRDGAMHSYSQTYMDEQDLANYEFRKPNEEGFKSLKDFVEEDDKDIYDRLREEAGQKARGAPQPAEAKDFSHLYQEAAENLPQTPTLSDYFEKQSMGKSPVDPFSGVDYENKVVDEAFERVEEALEDEQTYRKELIGRMFGGKLTPRQYAVLLKMNDDEREMAKLREKADYLQEDAAKDQIKVGEEMLESYRRRMVQVGEWPEVESRQLLQHKLDQIQEEFPVQSKFAIQKRDNLNAYDQLMQLRNSSEVAEREYYFDEGLGQSLNEHIAELKQQFPNVGLQTRRDRDGMPIVRLSLKQKFKYNLDELLATDPKEFKRLHLETQEAVTEVMMPQNPRDFVQAVDNGEVNIDSKAFESLVQQRMFGQYKDDLEGFKKELQFLKNKGGSSNDMHSFPDVNVNTINGKAQAMDHVQKMFQSEEAQFAAEIQTQMKLKMLDKLNFEKREQSDYVKPAMSENLMYRNQLSSIEETLDILEKDNEWQLNAGNNFETLTPEDKAQFDKEKYQKIKESIKMRKEAKQRLIKQGFPETKSYLRL